jgi:hypothetical protein
VLAHEIGESLVGQFLEGRHPMARQLVQLLECFVVEGDQLTHDRANLLRRDDLEFNVVRQKSFRNNRRALPFNHKGRISMAIKSRAASIVALTLLVVPVTSLAQSAGGGAGGGGSAGGAASGASAGTGSATGSPAAGAAGAGTAGVSGVPAGPANAGGLNNSGNDPSGVGNSAKTASPPPPGTNSLGTANTSGSTATKGSSMTTGAAGGSRGDGTAATGPQTSGDIAIDKETKTIDRKINSICRGC